jgi:hypothetical protein
MQPLSMVITYVKKLNIFEGVIWQTTVSETGAHWKPSIGCFRRAIYSVNNSMKLTIYLNAYITYISDVSFPVTCCLGYSFISKLKFVKSHITMSMLSFESKLTKLTVLLTTWLVLCPKVAGFTLKAKEVPLWLHNLLCSSLLLTYKYLV